MPISTISKESKPKGHPKGHPNRHQRFKVADRISTQFENMGLPFIADQITPNTQDDSTRGNHISRRISSNCFRG